MGSEKVTVTSLATSTPLAPSAGTVWVTVGGVVSVGGGGVLPEVVTTSSGRFEEASLELMSVPSLDVGAMLTLTRPVPATSGVTSYSTHVAEVMAAASATGPPTRAGRPESQVIVPSSHVGFVP
jgi:hypothetical protein